MKQLYCRSLSGWDGLLHYSAERKTPKPGQRKPRPRGGTANQRERGGRSARSVQSYSSVSVVVPACYGLPLTIHK